MQGLYAVGVAGVAIGIARAMLDAFEDLATRKTPRNLDAPRRQRGGAVERRADGGAPGRGARLPGRRRWPSIWATADERVGDRRAGASARAARLRVRHPDGRGGGESYAYKAAGVPDATFLGTAFERRFRDIHTLSQQIQSRTAHFKSVGQIMLGIEPPGTFL